MNNNGILSKFAGFSLVGVIVTMVAFKAYTNANGSTTHMTIVFNVFVIYNK